MQRSVLAVWRVVFAMSVTYVFAIILMTATAQQQVTAALADKLDDLDYSSAYVQHAGLDGLEARLPALEGSARKHAQEHVQALAARDEADQAFENAWQTIAPAVAALDRSGKCSNVAPEGVVTAWRWYNHCLTSDDLSDADKRRYASRLPTEVDLDTLHSRRLTFDRSSRQIDTLLQQDRDALADTQRQLKDGADLRGAFDELAVLKSPWLVGGTAFTAFPPVMLQIVLALAAGAFGALLLTLILTVYPNNDLKLTRGEVFELRVLLGGLIAVGVYIVLSGGASVLGSGGSLGSGPTNVMTFCAVGILAGMFSDRVAGWLSDKANVFFNRVTDQQRTR